MNFGRDKLPWSGELWNRLDQAVDAEVERTSVTRKILPLYGPVPDDTTAVPSDVFDPATGMVDEGQTTALIELSSEFFLTPQQVEKEADLGTAVTAALNRAHLVTQAEDLLVFQGANAAGAVVPLPANVAISSGRAARGLLNSVDAAAAPGLIIPVNQAAAGPDAALAAARAAARAARAARGAARAVARAVAPGGAPLMGLGGGAGGRLGGRAGGGAGGGPAIPPPARYGEQTVAAVNAAITALQAQQHYGPYALVLQTALFADAHAPLRTTLIMPADRIKPVVTAGFFSSPSLPNDRGLVLSLGGNSMDIVRSIDVTTAFSQVDPQGRYRFRVFERFALRLKRANAIARLEFV